jgi:small subunit ribosomal protein S6
MRRYETIFIVRPNVAEDEIEAVINKTSSIIEGDGGTIIKIDKWGLKKLAYLIKKETQGYYVHIDYAAIPASVSELERIFRIDDKVLKYLTVKLDDSCDPEAIKEELANAEAIETSTENEVKAEESSPSKPAKDETKEEESKPSEPAKDEAKEEEPEPSEPAKDEVKEESEPSEPAETSVENEAKKEEENSSEEEKA